MIWRRALERQAQLRIQKLIDRSAAEAHEELARTVAQAQTDLYWRSLYPVSFWGEPLTIRADRFTIGTVTDEGQHLAALRKRIQNLNWRYK